jgi:hypothetical protein
MAGELSPDRLFYWDGIRWVSVFSADGRWQWDGTTWRPAAAVATSGPTPARATSRLPWLIAAAVVAAVVVVSVGTYFVWGAVSRASQRYLVTTCASPLAQPGAALRSGGHLCGGTLGDERLLADCTLTDGTPSGTEVWAKSYSPKEGDWVKTTVTTSSEGCNLAAAPDVDLSFETSGHQPADEVEVVDFTLTDTLGVDVGMQLACTATASCVDFSIDGEGLYSLDEGIPNDGWDNLTKGYAFGSIPRLGANRMILRLLGKEVIVFLDGTLVTRAVTKRVQSPGFVTFYLDNRLNKAIQSVWLQRMYVFGSS